MQLQNGLFEKLKVKVICINEVDMFDKFECNYFFELYSVAVVYPE